MCLTPYEREVGPSNACKTRMCRPPWCPRQTGLLWLSLRKLQYHPWCYVQTTVICCIEPYGACHHAALLTQSMLQSLTCNLGHQLEPTWPLRSPQLPYRSLLLRKHVGGRSTSCPLVSRVANENLHPELRSYCVTSRDELKNHKVKSLSQCQPQRHLRTSSANLLGQGLNPKP